MQAVAVVGTPSTDRRSTDVVIRKRDVNIMTDMGFDSTMAFYSVIT